MIDSSYISANSDYEKFNSDKIGSIVCKRDTRLVNFGYFDKSLIDSSNICFLNYLFSTDLNKTVALNIIIITFLL